MFHDLWADDACQHGNDPQYDQKFQQGKTAVAVRVMFHGFPLKKSGGKIVDA
jgi:hypothetical protein